jgi:small-conductance mechanosensitive channel
MRDQFTIWSNLFEPWAWNLIIIALALVIGFIIKFVITSLLHYYKGNNDYSLMRSAILHLGPALNHFLPLLILNLMLPVLKLDKIIFNFISRTMEILLVASFAGVLISSLNVLQDYVFNVYNLNKDDNLKERKIRTQLQFIRKIIIVMIILITVAIILLSFDNVRKIGAGLLTGVGIGSIIIGFAARNHSEIYWPDSRSPLRNPLG